MSTSCQYEYPEGHRRAGERCTAVATRSTVYCISHTRSLGLSARATAAKELAAAVEGGADPVELAQASLSAEAHAVLHDPSVLRRIRKRWIRMIDNGSDDSMIKQVKELYAMLPEQQRSVEVPRTIQQARLMSDEDIAERLRQLEAKH